MMMCVSWNAKQLELDAIKHIFDAIIVYLPFYFFFFSLLSIHSSFSNTTRQIKWKIKENFRIIKIELLLHTKKKIFYIERTATFLLHSLFSRTYISSHRPNEQLFFFSQNTKAIAINHFFSSIFLHIKFHVQIHTHFERITHTWT